MSVPSRRRLELETEIIRKVGDVISAVNDAKHVDEVICALHSLAVLLFPVDSSLFSGSIDQRYRDQILGTMAPTPSEMDDWWHAFYRGTAFPTLARVLLYDVASNWLACFPFSARTHVYDYFFVNGPSSEILQAVVPCLQNNESVHDLNSVCVNAERILVLVLLENNGVLKMCREFRDVCRFEGFNSEQLMSVIAKVAQLVASIPDKARLEAPAALTSHIFFKQIASQLILGSDENAPELDNEADDLDRTSMDGTFLFIGELFARICRRGSADTLLDEMVPQILKHVRSCLLLHDSVVSNLFETKSGSWFWFKLIEAIKDPFSVERLSDHLLRKLAVECTSDVEAYWILWMLFHRTVKCQTVIRSMFMDKFLLWKVFPICCLRWILQFAILECPPNNGMLRKGQNSCGLSETVQRLVTVWSKREFVQSASMEQQAYITAAVGLSLENMSKEELEATKDVMHSILQGVSCRLESPVHLVRRMASCVAFVFSMVVDPKNPLYLDDSCRGKTIDWEFGLTTMENRTRVTSTSVMDKEVVLTADDRTKCKVKGRKKKVSEYKLVDPDEIIDPATLNNECSDEEGDGDDASDSSESLSDSSLQPYDLSDDDTDLKGRFLQLVDVVGALRKSDDPDGVERALDVAERLVRASPDELRHVTGDLVRALVQVRCSDLTIEGEEESAEGKREKALVALLVTCPFESLDTLNKLLYSPHVDLSQRILILDVMTDAAQELANVRSMTMKNQSRPLISTISETQPWFLPGSAGPPGASPWKEIPEAGALSWSYSYMRELPPKPGQVKMGKSRRWSLRSTKMESQVEWSKNKFPVYAAAFMLPAMQGYDKKRHGVDLLGRDFIVLGKLIYMLGICMKCAAMHPEASALAPAFLDMLSSRAISHHPEAYVRRSVLFAASCILKALHPSYVASALVEGNSEICKGLEWIRSWAIHVSESDTDTECSTLAMTCLQLHAEMALQTSRALESARSSFEAKDGGPTSSALMGEIKIPFSNLQF